MSELEMIQKRLDTIERELTDLKSRLPRPDHEAGWKAIVGIAKDYPEFDEVIRYGKELRESDRPNA